MDAPSAILQVIAEQRQHIAALEGEVAERDQRLAQKDAQIETLLNRVANDGTHTSTPA